MTGSSWLTATSPAPREIALARQVLSALVSRVPVPAYEAAHVLGVDWLRRQGLATLAYHCWRQATQLPPGLKQELQAAYYAGVAQSSLQRHELATVLGLLNGQRLQVVAFKGAALAYAVYSDPACRPMGDIDLWLKAGQLEEAAAALEQLGYQARLKPTRPLALMIRARNELPLYGTRSGSGLVELHWGVFPGEWLQRTTRIDDAELWARAVPATLADQPALILSPEDNLLQVAVHLAINHNMSAPWLRGLVDIALLVRHTPIDWTVIVQRARTWRVATAVWLVLGLAVDLAGLQEAAEAARELQPPALRRGLIGRFANAGALVMMRDLSASKWRYVFLLLLIDRERDALRLVYRALWPEREWLIARYERYTITTRLRHLFDAARGKI